MAWPLVLGGAVIGAGAGMGLAAGLGPKEEPLWKKLLVGGVGGGAIGAAGGAALGPAAGAGAGGTGVGVGGTGIATAPPVSVSGAATLTPTAPALYGTGMPVAGGLGSPVLTPGMIHPLAANAAGQSAGATLMPLAGASATPSVVAPTTGFVASGPSATGLIQPLGNIGTSTGTNIGGKGISLASTKIGSGTALGPTAVGSPSASGELGISAYNALRGVGQAAIDNPLMTGTLALGGGAILLPGGENDNEKGYESKYGRGDNSWTSGGSDEERRRAFSSGVSQYYNQFGGGFTGGVGRSFFS